MEPNINSELKIDDETHERYSHQIDEARLRFEQSGVRPNVLEYLPNSEENAVVFKEFFKLYFEMEAKICLETGITGHCRHDYLSLFNDRSEIIEEFFESRNRPPMIGDYVVDSLVNSDGGFGTVYRGLHKKGGRDVALKLINYGISSDLSQIKKSFDSEVHLQQLLKSNKGILKLEGTFPEPGLSTSEFHQHLADGHKMAIVFELLDGTLKDHIDREKELAAKKEKSNLGLLDKLRIVANIADTLFYAHSKEIVHRDLKPANIFCSFFSLAEPPKIKVGDFGIAAFESFLRTAHDKKMAGDLDQHEVDFLRIVTEDYGAPEQLNGGLITPKSDLYSIGSILYELLCLQKPFSNSLSKKALDRPLPPSKINPAIPPEVCRVCMECLEPRPEDRIESAAELRRRLTQIADTLCPSTGNYSWNSESSPPTNRIVTTVVEPHAIRTIVQAILNSNASNFEQLSRDLEIFADQFREILAFFPKKLDIDRLKKITSELGILEANELNLFVCESNTPEGWSCQLRLLRCDSQTPAKRELERILNYKLMLAKKPWIKDPEKLERIRASEPEEYADLLKEINFAAAINLGADDMLPAAQSDFSDERWRSIIDVEPNAVTNHLGFTSQIIADKFFEEIKFDKASSIKVENPLKIVEGGVGGSHTIFWILDRLTSKLSQIDPDWSVQYNGFEIVSDLAAYSDQLIGGKATIESQRSKLFKEQHQNHRLAPLSENQYVFNRTMENGVSQLVSSKRNHQGTIDLFVSSYAYHHVPSGQAIRSFLSGEHAPYEERLPSSLADVPNRNRIRKDICWGVKELWNGRKSLSSDHYFFHRQQVLARLKIGPAKVFLSLFEPLLIRGESEFQDYVDYLDNGLRDFKFKLKYLNCLLNPQQALLVNAFQLLRPGGIIAFGDPDGTSSFNAKMIVDDPEISIANFCSRESLIASLLQARFEIIHSFTVGREDGIFYTDTSAPARLLHGDNDPNLGFIVIAKKPANQRIGESFEY